MCACVCPDGGRLEIKRGFTAGGAAVSHISHANGHWELPTGQDAQLAPNAPLAQVVSEEPQTRSKRGPEVTFAPRRRDAATWGGHGLPLLLISALPTFEGRGHPPRPADDALAAKRML